MKILPLSVGIICVYSLIAGFSVCFGASATYEVIQKPAPSRWECHHCRKLNEDWTSICGKCGRSR